MKVSYKKVNRFVLETSFFSTFERYFLEAFNFKYRDDHKKLFCQLS